MTILEMKDLRKSYGSTPVLSGIDLTVEQGEFVGVIGLSGSGKSTLLRCVNRLIEPTGGAIYMPRAVFSADSDGAKIDVLRLGRAETRLLRRKIGMIFQHYNIVKRLTVLENVLSGALGYQSSVKSCLRLFTREQRRRALVLADEPVSSLDPKLSRVVLDILKRVCREDGITALVSLHTLDLTREYADRVIGLKQGRIFFDGPVKGLTDSVIEDIYQRAQA